MERPEARGEPGWKERRDSEPGCAHAPSSHWGLPHGAHGRCEEELETDASFKEFPRKGAEGESGSRGQMWNQESGGCSLFFLDAGNDGLCFGAAETDTPRGK